MTQLNSKQIIYIFQEALPKDGDFSKEIARIIIQGIMKEENGEQLGVVPSMPNYLKTIKGVKRHYS